MTNIHSQKRIQRVRRHARVRAVVTGTSDRPRLSVFRSSSHIYAQLIDDATGHTLATASSRDIKSKGLKRELSTQVGTAIAEKGKGKGVTTVVFDRGGNRYQGRVKALAEAARAAGLEF